MTETTYADRTDSFEEKLKLIDAAWKNKDYRLARSLAHSLRDSAIQAQTDEEDVGIPLETKVEPEVYEALRKDCQNAEAEP